MNKRFASLLLPCFLLASSRGFSEDPPPRFQPDDRWALELAEHLARTAGRTPHTHHSLSLCRGMIDLARVTGRKEYLDKVEDYLAWCREHRIVFGNRGLFFPGRTNVTL